MPSHVNRQIRLAARPEGLVKESDFELTEEPIPSPKDGEILIRALYLSVDPYMRGRITDRKSYADPVRLGAVMTGEIVGRVEASRNPKYEEGTIVQTATGWQEYAISDGKGVHRIREDGLPISTALHVLGMPGLTAYFGLLDICKPQSGETVVVSGAAGAVGSTVGQIAKIRGCRVVGIAGSDEKVQYLTGELGFDAGFNYKAVDNYHKALKELCPDGVDAYFDNVGGDITDAVFPRLKIGARVAICGQISQYNLEEPEQGPRLLWHLIVKRARVEGFLIFDFAPRFREALRTLREWVDSGELRYRENIIEGLENAPRAFIGLFHGENIGKQLVKVS